MESIEIYQSGNNDKSFESIITDKERDQGFVEFYDLEIEEDHCYFAENILVHNCHRVHGNRGTTQYGKVLTNLLSPIKIGFTATLPTEKNKLLSMEGLLGPVIDSLSMEEAVEKQIIAKPKITLLSPESPFNITHLKTYPEIYRKGIVNNELRNQMIVSETKKRIKENKTCLIMVKEINHGRNIEILANSKDFIFIHGATDIITRDKIKDAFENKNIKCVIATVIWNEGINIKSLDCVINACSGKSEIKTLQAIGRGLRKTNKKSEVEIIDFLDENKYLAEHSINRLRTYKSQGWI